MEKEPLTLEKDKEDQNKYYLSYPKPPVLDMKWANRDINVVAWVNIPKFSVLDDFVTTLRLLELFFVTLRIIISWYDFWLHQVVESRKQSLILKLLTKKFACF